MNTNNSTYDKNKVDDDDDSVAIMVFGCNAESAQKHLQSYAAREFQEGRARVLSLLPESYVQQWGHWYYLLEGGGGTCNNHNSRSSSCVFVLSPYNISPGKERTMWMDKFIEKLRSKNNDYKHPMSHMLHLYYDESMQAFGLACPSRLQPAKKKIRPPQLPPVVEIHERVTVAATTSSLPPIGTRIQVFWDQYKKYYAGVIQEHHGTDLALVKFEDGESHWLRLKDVCWNLEEEDESSLEEESYAASIYELSSSGPGADYFNTTSSSIKKRPRSKTKKRKKKSSVSYRDRDASPGTTTPSPRRIKPGIFSETATAAASNSSITTKSSRPTTSSASKLQDSDETAAVDRVALVSGTPCKKRRKTCSVTRRYLESNSKLNKLPNGLYARPRGRIPNGFIWDANLGLWKPVDYLFTTTTTATTTTTPAQAAAAATTTASSASASKKSAEKKRKSKTYIPEKEKKEKPIATTVKQQGHGNSSSNAVVAPVRTTTSVVAHAASAEEENSDMEVEWDGQLEEEGAAAMASTGDRTESTGGQSIDDFLSRMEAQEEDILAAVPQSHSRFFSQVGCSTIDGCYSFVQVISPFDKSVDDRVTKATWFQEFVDLKEDGSLDMLPYLVKCFEGHKVTFDLLEPSDFKPLNECPDEITAKHYASFAFQPKVCVGPLKKEEEPCGGFGAFKQKEDDVARARHVKGEDRRTPRPGPLVKQDDFSFAGSALSFTPTKLEDQGEAGATTLALVNDIKGQLEGILSSPSKSPSAALTDRCLSLLKHLDSLDITPDILLETKVSMTVKKFNKCDPPISAISKPLLKKWKKFYNTANERKLEHIAEMWNDVLKNANENPRDTAERIISFANDFCVTLKDYFEDELTRELAEKFCLENLIVQSSSIVDHLANDSFRQLLKKVEPYL